MKRGGVSPMEHLIPFGIQQPYTETADHLASEALEGQAAAQARHAARSVTDIVVIRKLTIAECSFDGAFEMVMAPIR